VHARIVPGDETALEGMVLESIERVKTLLREIGRLSPGSDKFKCIIQVLKDNVTHHARGKGEGRVRNRRSRRVGAVG
jgi:hypothetical protein